MCRIWSAMIIILSSQLPVIGYHGNASCWRWVSGQFLSRSNQRQVLGRLEQQLEQAAMLLPAGHVLHTQLAGPKITLLFLCLFVCVSTLIMYITYIVAMRPYFSQLWQFRRLLCVATMSSLAQSEMDTEKQRHRRRDNVRLTKSRNARSEQLLVISTESLTNREWLPGELLSGSER